MTEGYLYRLAWDENEKMKICIPRLTIKSLLKRSHSEREQSLTLTARCQLQEIGAGGIRHIGFQKFQWNGNSQSSKSRIEYSLT